jgi:hypothetical protein
MNIKMDIDILVPFLIILIITLITIFLIYPSARFNKIDDNKHNNEVLAYVYSPLWLISYGIIFYAWSILCKESTVAYYLVYIFSILQLLFLMEMYYFMKGDILSYIFFIVCLLVVLILSMIYQKVIVFILLIFNILLFFYFSQTIEKTTWSNTF